MCCWKAFSNWLCWLTNILTYLLLQTLEIEIDIIKFSFDHTANPPCNENRVFAAKFSLQGKTIGNENGVFPVKKTSKGKPRFHYRFFPVKVCSAESICKRTVNFVLIC